jgi:hypothetical protein
LIGRSGGRHLLPDRDHDKLGRVAASFTLMITP